VEGAAVSDAVERWAEWDADEIVGETSCRRCGGSGIDPVRVGLPSDAVACDPDWCSECGGCAQWSRYAHEIDNNLRAEIVAVVMAARRWTKIDVSCAECGQQAEDDLHEAIDTLEAALAEHVPEVKP
jgi:hypothetical protein